MTKIAVSTGDDTALLSAQFVDETDWHSLAPAAGGVGKFIMDLDRGFCEIDLTLQRMTGLLGHDGMMPAAVFFEHIHREDRAEVAARIEAARQAGGRFETEFRFAKSSGETIWLTGSGRPLKTGGGRNLLIGVNIDVTERRNAQERAELLAGEMAHRIKNLFTLVQSMFNMAARSSETREDLIEAFGGRLRALSAVNALTFSGIDRKVRLDELLGSILGPLVESGRITLDLTPGVQLNGVAGQTIVLAVNELMTNAVKYGALRHPDGHVAVAATVADGEFVLRWDERTPDPVTAPEGRGGFGMRVLNSMTAATYSGRPEFDWHPTGLSFRCTWPAQQVTWQDGLGYS
ncbi:MAG: HWE histidine kinase domain-containing protein, partial [Jannaschia sp.]